MGATIDLKHRPAFDTVMAEIADYVMSDAPFSDFAYDTARNCLMDTLGCGFLALNFPACVAVMGPEVPGTTVPNGARVPGTPHVLTPTEAAFNIGTMIRWLDYNDTWLAAEWGHPSDNLGGILAVADYLARTGHKLTMRDVLTAMIKAHEIQGVMALENCFNEMGLDHVLLVKLATAAVVCRMLGGTRDQVIATISHVFVDGQSLRTYRHKPNTGSRKSWAAGDATRRGVWLAQQVLKGEMGIPQALTAKGTDKLKGAGFYKVSFGDKPFKFQRGFGAYVMENVLFKIAFPAEYHAQTAAEAAMQLHAKVKGKADKIAKVELTTHKAAMDIISKGAMPLHNFADRDHCLEYMVAVPLLFGDLKAEHYDDAFAAAHPEIDALRAKMTAVEDVQYTKDYFDPEKRAFANAVQVFFTDGTKTDKVEVAFPLGHRRRRAEGIPLLEEKFLANARTRFDGSAVDAMFALMKDQKKLEATPVAGFMDLLVTRFAEKKTGTR